MNSKAAFETLLNPKIAVELAPELTEATALLPLIGLVDRAKGISDLVLPTAIVNQANLVSLKPLSTKSTVVTEPIPVLSSTSIAASSPTANRFGETTLTTANTSFALDSSLTSIDSDNVKALLGPKKWKETSAIGPVTQVTFGFTSSFNFDYESNYLAVSIPDTTRRNNILQQYTFTYGTLTAYQRGVTASWLNNSFRNVSGLMFQQLVTARDATIRIATANISGTGYDNRNHTYDLGNSSTSVDSVESGDVWYNTTASSGSNITAVPFIGSYGYFTMGHELGHALGLKHGSSAIGGGKNSIEFSIMTYQAYDGDVSGTKPKDFNWSQSLMMYDIRAIQQMYGARFDYEETNTIYTFEPTTGEMFINGIGQGKPGAGNPGTNIVFRTIWDGNGVDTYDFSNYGTNLSVDLTPGGWSDLDVGGNRQRANLDRNSNSHYARGHVFNALQFYGNAKSLIENANGGTGNDVLKGNLASNTLNGNNGNDIMYGGGGSDILIGGLGNDDLFGNEGNDNLIGGAGNDTINGDDIFGVSFVFGNDTISGGDGNDTVYGGYGNDYIDGDGGNDIVVGGYGNDSLNGGMGNDYLQGGAGNDLIFGGAGNDALDGDDGNDSLNGGIGDDILLGGAGNDTLIGGSGNDGLYGGGGNDIIDGSDGNDTVAGTFGDIRLDGGVGIDTLKFLTAANSPVDLNSYNINLTTGATNYGGLVLNFENLSTNSGNDTLVGSAAKNLIESGAGNDFINGGAGDDTIIGGAGNDLLYGGVGVDGFLLERTGIDTIADFVSNGSPLTNDYLGVFAGSFGGRLNLGIPIVLTGPSLLPATAFLSGAGATKALSTTQRFIFNTTDRSLYFDVDGLGGVASSKIAILSNTTTLSSNNFLVI
jgi:serralysin